MVKILTFDFHKVQSAFTQQYFGILLEKFRLGFKNKYSRTRAQKKKYICKVDKFLTKSKNA